MEQRAWAEAVNLGGQVPEPKASSLETGLPSGSKSVACSNSSVVSVSSVISSPPGKTERARSGDSGARLFCRNANERAMQNDFGHNPLVADLAGARDPAGL